MGDKGGKKDKEKSKQQQVKKQKQGEHDKAGQEALSRNSVKPIRVRGDELVDEVALGSHDFDAVVPGFARE